MNKKKIMFDKRRLLNTLSVLLIILGISSIVWAIFNIPSELSYNQDDIATIQNINTIPDIQPVKEKADINLYPIHPIKGENIGSLTIPALERKIPIFEGTEKNELKQGAGHFIESALPGENDNTVISGHSQTVFKKLDNLKRGDLLIVQTSAGKFTYEIDDIKIVHKDDRTIIVPIDHAVLTLTTCYPFNFVGSEPYRYIVSAKLIQSE